MNYYRSLHKDFGYPPKTDYEVEEIPPEEAEKALTEGELEKYREWENGND